ncbi:DNA mismatch repair protein MSH6 [Abrus precatorius]|uniref:DNA mismatch repair protein n=1 Tax=Abrus precatorius TaxID=3816 RepID=A0A8B8L0A7_ABRPR|nr:DNA mismatch repair protein MSH6 [Abrus precatorius]
MAPSRRNSNGRSPLVNQQRQITSFFSKHPSPTNPKTNPKLSPNHISDPNPNPSHSPTVPTPSPLDSKPHKPLLLIGASSSPSSSSSLYATEVIGRRVKVYWPLDKAWYEGLVKSFDNLTSKHLVHYDDGEEESLDLSKEKIEWLHDSSSKKLRRLRRGVPAVRKMVIEDDEVEESRKEEDHEHDDDGDDSNDEDWGKNAALEDAGDDGEEDTDLEDECDVEERVKGRSSGKVESKKRKLIRTEKAEPAKKSKSGGEVGKGAFKLSVAEPTSILEIKKASNGADNVANVEVSERFASRDNQKLRFLREDRRDAKRRRPGDENYDSRTLYLPPGFLGSLSDGQKQWWEFKSKHMDKVLFFKMGKFYELFEMDAHVGVKELDLQYMKGEQPHCGFPERNFSMNVEKLARKGYRVLVVEQTETPEQLELRRKEKGSKDKVVRREICAVVTKGTLTDGELLSANPEAAYLMALTEHHQNLQNEISEHIYGVCMVDVATSRVILGQFKDDSECSALCCILSEIRPVEIVKPAKLLSAETERVLLKHTRSPLVNELVPTVEFWDADKTVDQLKRIYRDPEDVSVEDSGLDCLPDVLQELVKTGDDSRSALSALGGALYYLKQAFLDEGLLRFAQFELLPCSGLGNLASKPYMVLDAAALENLEIFENSRNGDSSGTLYAQLNQCVTAFGKRLLKTWLARPLCNVELIKERQEAVAGLKGVNLPYALEFRKALSRLPDMERLLARIFSTSEASGRNANKVVLYEDASKKQLQEFISALRGCEQMAQACSSLGVILKGVKSGQLNHLLTPGKGLPDICLDLNHFKDAFNWVEASNSGRIIPHEGVDMEYDSACKAVKEVEASLLKHLKEQRKLLGDTSINYVNIGKETYLLEVPENLSRNIPQDYELRSSRKGFFRYWTPDIKKFLRELSQAESEKEFLLKSILHRLIGRFSEHHTKWKQLVSTTAELDVLISLAIASDYYEGPTCRPSFIGTLCTTETKAPYLHAKSLGHPVLRSDTLGKGAFVPNDITIGGPDHASFILLTGPNMGGKSTLLRQVCLAVILAQVGADVPAESFVLSPVDRIFVRMGAKDNILAGQSTFLTELSETATMLLSATCNSLVALDELGRGTSTSDGQAIAESVLEHLVRRVQCRGLFSTHYHRLAIDYLKDPKVCLCHMACQVGGGIAGLDEVTFLYRLTLGACPKSYGVNVARLAGLPTSVLQKAAAKSREFEATYGKCRKKSKETNSANQNWFDKIAVIIQKLNNAATNLSCQETICVSSLRELQDKARELMQRC